MYAILPAAGSGSRMGLHTVERPKVLLALGSHGSILELAVKNLVRAGVLRGIIIPAQEEHKDEIEDILQRVAPELDCHTVTGGSTRQQSVYAGLKAIRGQAEFALVHDAARPLCSSETVKEAVSYCRKHGPCVVAVPSICTLKQVSADGAVLETIDRSSIWEAQTPQVFPFAVLWQAHEQARKTGYLGTDESELVERIGHRVGIVRGTASNIKVTTPDDLAYAEFLLNGGKRVPPG